jgi:hypothetical protein
MTSPYERPDRAALADLGPLVEALGQELASWHARALKAEAHSGELGGRGGQAGAGVAPADAEQLASLEAEATELRRRLDRAREQVDMLRTRLRFLEERTEGAA